MFILPCALPPKNTRFINTCMVSPIRVGLFLIGFAISVMTFQAMAAEKNQNRTIPHAITALDVFARLPLTIFEDTVEGLSEEEKQQLIDRGSSEFWLLEKESDDSLVLLSRPFGETRVQLRLFRGGPTGLMAVIGSDNKPICNLEMWTLDEVGGLVPSDLPEAPPVADLFEQGYHLPKNISPALFFCVANNGLNIRAVFWSPEGLATTIIPRNTVQYEWKNGAFMKKIVPALP